MTKTGTAAPATAAFITWANRYETEGSNAATEALKTETVRLVLVHADAQNTAARNAARGVTAAANADQVHAVAAQELYADARLTY
jgi:hypothetical protein